MKEYGRYLISCRYRTYGTVYDAQYLMWQEFLGTCQGSHLPGTLHCSFKLVELVYILFLLNNIYEQASNINAVS